MKHYIIVKFKQGFDYNSSIADITAIFKKTLEIEGVNSVLVKPSNSERENRYDLMIEMDMEKEALPLYDVSSPHVFWKEKYGGYIDKKAIFDCD
ncbi:MAG: hypothetical protein J6T73_06965 [Clostridia bacterium]|nr:hypothetical protein [Clostridia bacterium]